MSAIAIVGITVFVAWALLLPAGFVVAERIERRRCEQRSFDHLVELVELEALWRLPSW